MSNQIQDKAHSQAQGQHAQAGAGHAHTSGPHREIILFIGKPKGRSRMISNATNPLKESRKEPLLRCAGSTSICVWLVCDLVVMCIQAVGDRALGDLCVCVRCGSVQSQKYESVVIGLDLRVKVVSEEQKASLLDS